jgi:hypothetical protein
VVLAHVHVGPFFSGSVDANYLQQQVVAGYVVRG